MKNVFYLLFIAFLISCGSKNSRHSSSLPGADSTQVPVDSFAFEVDTFHVLKKQKDCKGPDCAMCDLYYEKIRNKGIAVFDSVNLYIDSILPNALMDMDGDKGPVNLEKIANDFIQTSQDPEFKDMGGTWTYDMHLYITRPCNTFIQVAFSYGGYTGGAHGNYAAQTTNFFVKDGHMITMENLFNDLDKVNQLGLKYFKKDNNLSAEDIQDQGWDISDSTFTLNNNFSITAGSIVWQYNSYEIGSYANGAPTVTIPMSELSGYLKVKVCD